MDDTLKQLLAAEGAATELVKKAEQDSDHLIQTAVQEARAQEARFEDRKPELHAAFLEKSDQRAKQSIAEMDRRFQERLAQLRSAAEQNEERALEAAFREMLERNTAGDV